MSIVLEVTRHGEWFLQWVEDDDPGAAVGQEAKESSEELERLLKLAREKHEKDNVEFFAVELAVRRAIQSGDIGPGRYEDNIGGYGFESKSAARAALRLAKRTLKHAHDSTPMPDWAIKALSEGWTAPRGWKP